MLGRSQRGPAGVGGGGGWHPLVGAKLQQRRGWGLACFCPGA